MRPSLTTSLLAAGLAVLLLGAKGPAEDPKLDAPPAGLNPTTEKLSLLLAAYDKAAGTKPSGILDSSIEDWTYSERGVTGTEHLERVRSDYHSKLVYGPFVNEYGQFGPVRWHKDDNGFVSETTTVDNQSFFAERVLDDASDPKNDVSIAGEAAGDHSAYVVKVKRPGYHHPEWIFFDSSTSLISRVERVANGRRIVDTYDDYRTTDGMTRPWHVHDSDGRTGLDDDWHRTSLAYGQQIAPSEFVPPKSQSSIEGIMTAGSLPVKMVRGNMIIRLSVKGRGLDFQLDSGSRTSVIDRDVARELDLPTFGQSTELSDGTKIKYRTMIEDGSTGPIRFQKFALTSETFNYQATQDVKVVGVLGYDFLAANVFRVDYVNGTVDVIPAASFTGAQPVKDGLTIPVVLDDGLPMVSMGVGEGLSDRVLLNTSMPFTVIFGGYIDDHTADFQDLPFAEHHRALVPFADDQSFGRSIDFWLTRASHMKFGPSDYQKIEVVATNMPYSDPDIDAVVGTDYLAYYDLYFDYSNNRIIIKPNDWFFKEFKFQPGG